MRLRQIEAFRAVMTSGGVTAAARLLHISQPSISRLIADLEAGVGFALFERRGARVFPTAQARQLFEAVQRSFAGLDLLEQAARRIRAHPVGTIRVAALAALAYGVLPAALKKFQASNPEVKVTVEALGQQGVEDRVFLGQADLGFVVAAASREGVIVAPLVQAEYVVILPSQHRLAKKRSIAAADLKGEAFIGPMHEADVLWFGIDEALASVKLARKLESQNSLTVYAFVEAGLGVAIVEPFTAPLFQKLGVVARPFRPRLAVDFAVLEPGIGQTPPAIAQFRTEVAAAAAARLIETARLATA